MIGFHKRREDLSARIRRVLNAKWLLQSMGPDCQSCEARSKQSCRDLAAMDEAKPPPSAQSMHMVAVEMRQNVCPVQLRKMINEDHGPRQRHVHAGVQIE